MNTINDGGPALPAEGPSPGQFDCSGMSLRDYFAAKICAAMVSTIRNDDDYRRAENLAMQMGFGGLSEWFAADSYKQADAMLKAREQTND